MALSQQNGNKKGHHDTLKSLGLGIKGKDKIALNKISLKLRNQRINQYHKLAGNQIAHQNSMDLQQAQIQALMSSNFLQTLKK